MSLRKKKKSKHGGASLVSDGDGHGPTAAPLSESLSRMRIRNESPNSVSQRSSGSDHGSSTPSLSRKNRRKKCDEIEMGIKNVEVVDGSTTLHTVEVIKRPGQTLGFYIREGNGKTMKKGVFISRIAEGSIVQSNGLLKVGDEIQAINSVNVTRTNLDDVVVLMSIPKRLILTIKSHRQDQRLSSGSGYSDIKPVYIHKQYSDDSESIRQYQTPAEINTEDSNDSGLSSEPSLRGERLTETAGLTDTHLHYASNQPAINHPRASLPNTNLTIPEPVYARPRPKKSELYVSDGEHEYSPVPKLRNGSVHKDYRIHRNQPSTTSDAYNSDSELLPKCHSAAPKRQPQSHWSSTTSSNSQHHQLMNETKCATLKPPAFSSEMQNWLRKFDHISDETRPLPPSEHTEALSATHELDGYRNELWRQEKLLNDAIYNMESALNVDAMLQQSTHPNMIQTNSLQRNATMGGINPPGMYNPGAASAYSYLKDLPLLIRTPMKVKIDEFSLYRPEYERINSTDVMPAGTMKLKIYCGHGLKSSRNSLRDVYCVIQLDSVKQAKTMIRTGAINFDWDETFDMVVEGGTGNLLCMIYHWDPQIRHRLCFTGTVRLANLFDKAAYGPQNCKCGLKLEPTGILYLEVSYCRDHSKDNSEQPHSTIFGRPLRDVLSRQGTETSVPLLLVKCVAEVASRGMGVVGIYRLCGGAKKKYQLRQEFEKHPRLVNLSPSNVPEIHAITGLLKDYLRELPDSLLTAKAYQVIERALSKDTTQDADLDSLEVANEFVAKLQPWQQGTVVFMLNHLKQVTLHQADNKMSTSNLAVCFGPIFVPPQDPETNAGAEANSMRLHIEIIKYLLDIWPQEYSTNNNIVI